MKKLLLASALLALTAAPVMADEAQDTAPEPVEYEAQDTGSKGGFYGGLQAMYAMQLIKKGNGKQELAKALSNNPKGFGGGLFLGYGHAFNRFYLGGELAYAYGAVNAKKNLLRVNGTYGGMAVRGSIDTKMELKHFADFAIHPGVILPRGFTPYAILGLRYIRGKFTASGAGTIDGQRLSRSGSQTMHGIGPRLGLGLKWKPSASPFFVGTECAWSSVEMKVKGHEKFDGIKTNNMDVKVKVGYQF